MSQCQHSMPVQETAQVQQPIQKTNTLAGSQTRIYCLTMLTVTPQTLAMTALVTRLFLWYYGLTS